MEISKKPQNIYHLATDVFKVYPLMFKTILPLVLVTVALTVISMALATLNPTVGLASTVLLLLAIMFLYSVLLHLADSVLHGKVMNMSQSIEVGKKQFLNVMACVGVYILVYAILLAVNTGLRYLGHLFDFQLVFAFIAAALNFYVFILLLFVVPLVILDKLSVRSAFEGSINLVMGSWWHVFAVMLVLISVIFFLSSMAVLIVPSHHVIYLSITSFIFQVIGYPLSVATILIVFNDLKLRKKALMAELEKESKPAKKQAKKKSKK